MQKRWAKWVPIEHCRVGIVLPSKDGMRRVATAIGFHLASIGCVYADVSIANFYQSEPEWSCEYSAAGPEMIGKQSQRNEADKFPKIIARNSHKRLRTQKLTHESNIDFEVFFQNGQCALRFSASHLELVALDKLFIDGSMNFNHVVAQIRSFATDFNQVSQQFVESLDKPVLRTNDAYRVLKKFHLNESPLNERPTEHPFDRELSALMYSDGRNYPIVAGVFIDDSLFIYSFLGAKN